MKCYSVEIIKNRYNYEPYNSTQKFNFLYRDNLIKSI